MVAQSSQIGDSGPHAVVEVESVHGLEGRGCEERLVGIEVALVLRKGVGPWQDRRNTSHRKLAGDVALAAAEKEGSPARGAENRAESPTSQHAIHDTVRF